MPANFNSLSLTEQAVLRGKLRREREKYLQSLVAKPEVKKEVSKVARIRPPSAAQIAAAKKEAEKQYMVPERPISDEEKY